MEGDLPLNQAVIEAMSKYTRILTAISHGASAWAKIVKISVVLKDGTPKMYFLKCATEEAAQAMIEGEYHSVTAIDVLVPGLVPKAVGWGKYDDFDGLPTYFYLGDFLDMDLSSPPEPHEFTSLLAKLHEKGSSPNGLFGFSVKTACGKMQRAVTWENNWVKSFTNHLQKIIDYDNEINGHWSEFDAAYKQLIAAVILRLLGALQVEGREITPTLIHGDLWENNVGIDKETGNIILFDPGSIYAHNEMEFGIWRCSWASRFTSPEYQRLYRRHIKPSEPAEEWDDRNRLYSLHPNLNASADHPGSKWREIAYNDMLFLCEKYGSWESIQKYDPKKDIAVTGAYAHFDIMAKNNQVKPDHQRIYIV